MFMSTGKEGICIIKKWNDFFAGLPMTIVGGIFLVFSLFLMLKKIHVPVDPAWVSVIICGIPLLYLALWRVVHNKGMRKISSALLISMAMIAAIAIGDIFAAGEVAFIMAIGAILEDKTAERSKKGLKKLIGLAPQKGRRCYRTGCVLSLRIGFGNTYRNYGGYRPGH
jgi:Cu+-exporting ATPase